MKEQPASEIEKKMPSGQMHMIFSVNKIVNFFPLDGYACESNDGTQSSG